MAYTREEKPDPSQTVAQHRAGMSNLQVMLPMIYSDGVRSGRITLERFVEVTSANAAKLFGLYPRKGTIAVGSDTDLVVWDPEETRIIRDEDLLSGSGYSVHAGTVVTGWPTMTFRRGEVVFRDGDVLGTPGSGELLRRERWQDPALSNRLTSSRDRAWTAGGSTRTGVSAGSGEHRLTVAFRDQAAAREWIRTRSRGCDTARCAPSCRACDRRRPTRHWPALPWA